VYYQLVDATEARENDDGTTEIGLMSAGQWFALGQLADAPSGEAP